MAGELQKTTVDPMSIIAELLAVQKKQLDIQMAKEKAIDDEKLAFVAKRAKDRAEALKQTLMRKQLEELKHERCSHEDKRGTSTIFPISNFHDGRGIRGICVQCHLMVQPAHLEYGYDDKTTLIPEHPLYKIVLRRENDLYSEFMPMTSY